MSSLYSFLLAAESNASALRLIVKLKPANADGIIYPPTYEGGKHIFRPAWIDGKERQAVLLDSVQSQAIASSRPSWMPTVGKELPIQISN